MFGEVIGINVRQCMWMLKQKQVVFEIKCTCKLWMLVKLGDIYNMFAFQR